MIFKNIYDIQNYICIDEKFVIQYKPEFPYVYVHAYKFNNIFYLGIIF